MAGAGVFHGGLSLTELAATIVRAVENTELGLSIVGQVDGAWVRLYGNDALFRIYGYSRDEMEHLPPMVHLPDDERVRLKDFVAQVAAGRPPREHVETVVLGKDGRRIPIDIGFAVDTFDGHPVTVAFVRDISARRRIEEELRASEARFRQLAEEAPDVIMVTQSGKFVYANPTTAQTLGYDSVDDVLALDLRDFLPPDELAMMRDRFARILQGERMPPVTYHGKRKDGSRAAVEFSAIRIEWSGAPAVLGIGRDVQDRNRLQTRLLQADRMAAVGTLAAGVAHEINNPLAYVMLHLERLRRTLDQRTVEAMRVDTAHALDEALEGARRVADIVRDLLSFARTEEDDGRVDCIPILESTLRLATTSLKHRARVRTELPRVPPVRGNEGRLGQVFLNILTNALQAFEREDPDVNEVTVRARTEPGTVVVEIRDNGRGIPFEVQHRIFEPFFTTKPPGSGTGLGLSVTRSILDGMGGAISVDSQPGRGTGVCLRLPMAIGAGAAPRRSGPAATASARGARILIVDDEAPLASALCQLLEGVHDCEHSTDSRIAFERLKQEKFDLILCDLIMPGMNGWELYDAVTREQPDYAERFLFITGGAATDEASAFVSRRPRDILAKPLDIENLLAQIDQRLTRRAR